MCKIVGINIFFLRSIWIFELVYLEEGRWIYKVYNFIFLFV